VSLAAVVIAALALGAGAVDETRFRYTRTLPPEVAEGRVGFEPDGAMLAHTRDGFGDLRVLDAEGNPVPWRRVPEERRGVGRVASVLNSGVRGGAAVALVDVGPRPGPYTRVELVLEGGNFVGRVTAFGADRRAGPFTRLSTTTVYDVEGAEAARSTTIVLPPTDHRYLELRATGVRRISGAVVLGEFERPELVRRRHRLLPPEQTGAATVLLLDLGVRGVPVTRLELRADAPAAFDRPVRVEGSNDRETWVTVGVGRTTRAPGLLSPPLDLVSELRYLRVTVRNGDDPPLERIRTETFGPSFALMVEAGRPGPLRLLYGAQVAAPSYEFARLPVDRPIRVLDASQLPPERANPAFAAPGRSFGERNRWVVQAALGLAALVVGVAGFLALRRRA
jgi:hypothetical protein